MPKGWEEYLTLAPRPKTVEAFLRGQVAILERLVQEADEGEIRAANYLVEDNIPMDVLPALPADLFKDPRMPRDLLGLKLEPEHRMARWKARIPELIKEPQEAIQEAQSEGEALTLESFLGRLM